MEGAGARARERFEWAVRVYHEDVDDLGVVYYANYLRYMERARTEWLRALGVAQSTLAREHHAGFVVSRAAAEFLVPARYDDALVVDVALERLGRASLRLAQRVCRARGEILCRAEVRVACIDAGTLRPRAIPEPVLAELRR